MLAQIGDFIHRPGNFIYYIYKLQKQTYPFIELSIKKHKAAADANPPLRRSHLTSQLFQPPIIFQRPAMLI